MLSTPWWLPPPEVVLGYQHALLSDFRLVPARHSARRSIVVPFLEPAGPDPCYTRNTGIVHPPLGMTAPGLQMLVSSPHERSEMRETPDVIGLRLLEQLPDIGTHRRRGGRMTSQSRFLRFNRICRSNLRSYFFPSAHTASSTSNC